MTAPLEKAELRKIFKQKRSSLSKKEAAEKSQKICQNFLQNLLPNIYQKNSKDIFALYLESSKEVVTTSIAEFFKKNSINFSYPKITNKDQPLSFILFNDNQKFVPNKLYPKILEPLDGKVVFPNFIILPLLAFDSGLSRLGMGGGFYDRTIEHLKSQKIEFITIGLGYEFQRLHDHLKIEDTDQKLDFIVTEDMILSASQMCVNLRHAGKLLNK